jgi:hypothetical protein
MDDDKNGDTNNFNYRERGRLRETRTFKYRIEIEDSCTERTQGDMKSSEIRANIQNNVSQSLAQGFFLSRQGTGSPSPSPN